MYLFLHYLTGGAQGGKVDWNPHFLALSPLWFQLPGLCPFLLSVLNEVHGLRIWRILNFFSVLASSHPINLSL